MYGVIIVAVTLSCLVPSELLVSTNIRQMFLYLIYIRQIKHRMKLRNWSACLAPVGKITNTTWEVTDNE